MRSRRGRPAITTSPAPDAMSPEEAIRARETLGLSPEELADVLRVSPERVRAWEAGEGRIPLRAARRLAFDAERLRQERALEEAGLPECEWIKNWTPPRRGFLFRDPEEGLDRVRYHLGRCTVCNARERYARQHFSPIPLPLSSGLLGLAEARLEHLTAFLGTRPAWQRSTAYGALGGACVTVYFVALWLAGLPHSSARDLLENLLRLPLLMGIGAYTGLVGNFLYRWMRRKAEGGPLASFVAGMAGMGGLSAAFLGPPLVLFVGIVPAAIGIAGGTLFFGPFAGYFLNRDRSRRAEPLADRG